MSEVAISYNRTKLRPLPSPCAAVMANRLPNPCGAALVRIQGSVATHKPHVREGVPLA